MTTVVGVQVSSLAPRRSKRHIVCSDFFQKSERTHSVAPPFQITTAPPGCDLVGKRLSKHSCRLGIRRNKRHTVCPAFFKSRSKRILLLLLSKSQPLRRVVIWWENGFQSIAAVWAYAGTNDIPFAQLFSKVGANAFCCSSSPNHNRSAGL